MHDFNQKSTDRRGKSDNDKYSSNKKAEKKKKTTHLIELFKVILGSLGITGY